MGRRIAALLAVALAATLGLSPVPVREATGDAQQLARWQRAIRDNDVAGLREMLKSGFPPHHAARDGKTALMAAAAGGDAQLLGRLIDVLGGVATLNERGGSALMYAAANGHLPAIDLLLEAGAVIDRRAANGWTALTLAAAKGHASIATRLLAEGADPNVQDVFGWTPLMRAVANRKTHSADVLLGDPRVAVDRVNALGRTALHVAIETGNCESIPALMSAGLKPSDADFSGVTVAALATRTSNCRESLR